MPNKPDISVIVPIYNESKIIGELFQRLSTALLTISPEFEIIFVNDGSRDSSLEKLIELSNKDKRVFYINFSRNFGHQIAVSAGLDHASGKAIVIIDGDLQDPPELIPELYKKYKEGYEVVYAQRRQREGESAFKKLTAKFFYRLLNKMTSIEIPLDTGDFRLMDSKVKDYLLKMPEQNKFLRGQIAWLGFRQTAVQFDRDSRKYGTTGYSLNKMLKFAVDGITGFSDKPLNFVTRFGVILSLVSFLVILYALYSYFILNHVMRGWTSMIISFSLIGGIQLLSIGIIGEYLARINKNVLQRPLYIIWDTNLPDSKLGSKNINTNMQENQDSPA